MICRHVGVGFMVNLIEKPNLHNKCQKVRSTFQQRPHCTYNWERRRKTNVKKNQKPSHESTACVVLYTIDCLYVIIVNKAF